MFYFIEAMACMEAGHEFTWTYSQRADKSEIFNAQ